MQCPAKVAHHIRAQVEAGVGGWGMGRVYGFDVSVCVRERVCVSFKRGEARVLGNYQTQEHEKNRKKKNVQEKKNYI